MNKFLITLLAVTSASFSLTNLHAGDWPNWRGPAGNGTALDGTYPASWGSNNVAWKLELPGKGGSTPIVWKNRIYLTTPADGHDAVMALDMAGKQLWITKLGQFSPPKHKTLSSSCNSSPVTDGQGIFAQFRSGPLVALELDGSVRWQINLKERFGPENLYWDQGSSPAVTSQHVIVTRQHHGDSWIAGFDKATGELRWQQKRNYETSAENDNGYTTPILFDYQGKQAFLIWGAEHLTAHSATDGALLWSCGGFNPRRMENWPAIASPTVQDGIAIVPVGRDDRQGQAGIHGIRMDGAGDVTTTNRVWKRDDVGVFCCSPAAFKGRIYLMQYRGGVVCLDPATGKTIWTGAFPKGAANYYASPAIANDILYAAREDGTVFTARIGDRFELLSENALGERIVASPVLANDCLILRSDKHLFSIR